MKKMHEIAILLQLIVNVNSTMLHFYTQSASFSLSDGRNGFLKFTIKINIRESRSRQMSVRISNNTSESLISQRFVIIRRRSDYISL